MLNVVKEVDYTIQLLKELGLHSNASVTVKNDNMQAVNDAKTGKTSDDVKHVSTSIIRLLLRTPLTC